MLKNLKYIILISGLVFSQDYSEGDTISESDQNIEFDICSGSNESTLSLSDFEDKVILIAVFATW